MFLVSIEKWSPALQIRTVLLSIQALLSAPNPDDFLDADVAEKWKSDEHGAKAKGVNEIPRNKTCLSLPICLAREWTLQYAHES